MAENYDDEWFTAYNKLVDKHGSFKSHIDDVPAEMFASKYEYHAGASPIPFVWDLAKLLPDGDGTYKPTS